ncbi:MAG TPA: MoxR family ATPase [Planctomycetota bacterium]|nr:MoxR family ATPase [Planctomycetota bacterium]
MADEPTNSDLQAVEKLNASYHKLCSEIAKVIVGQEHVLEEVLIAIFCRGHCLLVGVPGLAKTLMVRTLSEVLALSFKRIQFTPDLMPADITGTEILQETEHGERVFRFMQGPIFANVILADEINRTPPKTQAALLEAMQEHRVTSGNRCFTLDEPFFVLATQNPIEQEGTYPLPEAQLDRFMFNIYVDYPLRDEEMRIVKSTTTAHVPQLDRMLNAHEIIELQDIVRKVPVADHVYEYAVDLAIGTRPGDTARPFIREWVSWGAGPRASQYLILGAKARAILNGRYHATTEDVKAVALPVLRHRVITNFNAESEGVTSDSIIRRLLEETPTRAKAI